MKGHNLLHAGQEDEDAPDRHQWRVSLGAGATLAAADVLERGLDQVVVCIILPHRPDSLRCLRAVLLPNLRRRRRLLGDARAPPHVALRHDLRRVAAARAEGGGGGGAAGARAQDPEDVPSD